MYHTAHIYTFSSLFYLPMHVMAGILVWRCACNNKGSMCCSSALTDLMRVCMLLYCLAGFTLC